MAEKGIIVKDATSGESIACRDAVAQDDQAHDRIVQLIDKAPRPVVFQRTTPLRAITAGDAMDIDPLPAGIAANLLDVSDAESCVVWAVINLGSTAVDTLNVVVTPILVSEDVTPVAVALLAPMDLRPVDPTKGGGISPDNLLRISGGVAFASSFLTLARTFPTHGVKELGFHITLNGLATPTSVQIFAAPVSCVGRDYCIDAEVQADVWGQDFPAIVAGC